MKKTEKPGFFRSLFGGSQPVPRREALPLYIPLAASKMDEEDVPNVEAMWNQVTQRQLPPLMLLQEISRYLDRINPMPLSYEQRLRMSNILLNEVAVAISKLFIRFFQQGGGIPETQEQRESISHAVRSAEQLAISYKLLFRDDWGGEPGEDHATDERLLAGMLRILECVRLEQLLRAFRYQKLPQQAWRDINQIFFALREGWDIGSVKPVNIRFAVEDSASRVELFPSSASVEQLYMTIQLTGLLDVISWPVHLMYRVGNYLDEIDSPVISEDHPGDALPRGSIVVFRNRGMPPSFNRNQDTSGEALLININPVIRRIEQDRDEVVPAPPEPAGSETLSAMPERDCTLFLDLLLQRLQPRQRSDVRQRVFEANHARVYGGFEEVHRLFHNIALRQRQPKDAVHDMHFFDDIAVHGGTVGHGDDLREQPRWIIADESPGGMQLRQQEGDYSMPLYVGRLVAYSTESEELSVSRLGYVARIQRLDDEVEVAITRLRGEISAAMAMDLDSTEHRSAPAMLIRNVDGKLRLLCDNKHKFITGERLTVTSDEHSYTAALGDVVLTQGDFTVFELHTAE